MAKKRFRQIYEELPKTPPKTAFLQRIAEITCRNIFTVRMWVSGRQIPDELAQKTIASELGVPVSDLFPEVLIK